MRDGIFRAYDANWKLKAFVVVSSTYIAGEKKRKKEKKEKKKRKKKETKKKRKKKKKKIQIYGNKKQFGDLGVSRGWGVGCCCQTSSSLFSFPCSADYERG